MDVPVPVSVPVPVPVPVRETLRELLATSKTLVDAADEGNAEGVASTLAERARLIERLPTELGPGQDEERALLTKLLEQDRAAVRRLEEWRAQIGRQLGGLGTARAAAAGYARVTESNPAVIDRDL